MFGDIPDGKGTFQDYKNIDYRNSQNLRISKGVSPWLSEKFAIYSSFLFNQNRLRKRVSYVNEI